MTEVLVMEIAAMTMEQLNETTGYAMGWIDFPTDSIEQGNKFYFDRERAPFGLGILKRDWNPIANDYQSNKIMTKFELSVKVTTDAIIVYHEGDDSSKEVKVYRSQENPLGVSIRLGIAYWAANHYLQNNE